MLSAGYARIRPVLMTATAMILGMLPMSLGLGEGGEQNAPLGRAVIGGLMFATVTTLFVVPIIYSYLRTKPPVDHERRLQSRWNRSVVSAMHSERVPEPAEEERLRRENEDLSRQLAGAEGRGARRGNRTADQLWHPSGITIWAIFLAVVLIIAWRFFAGYIPLQKRRRCDRERGAASRNSALPRVEVIEVGRAPVKQRAATARQHPGDHRSSHSGARRRLHPAPHGGHRRSRARPASRWPRSKRPEMDEQVRQAKASAAAGAGGARPGARQLRAGQVRHGTGARHGGALGQPDCQGRGLAAG